MESPGGIGRVLEFFDGLAAEIVAGCSCQGVSGDEGGAGLWRGLQGKGGGHEPAKRTMAPAEGLRTRSMVVWALRWDEVRAT